MADQHTIAATVDSGTARSESSLIGTTVAVLGAAAMTFAGLMKIFNTEFRDDMAANYDVFGGEIPVWFFVLVGLAELAIAVLILYKPTRLLGAAALTMFMTGALILNLGFAKEVLAEGVRDQSKAWPANLVLAVLGLAIAFLAQKRPDRRLTV